MTDLGSLHDRAGWDNAASSYARLSEPGTALFARSTLELLGVTPGVRLLDVAAGTGALTTIAARAGAQVLAVDFSEAMIDYLTRRVAQEGLDVECRVMDGQALDLEDGAFDIVSSVFGIFLFPDHRRGLTEARRVTRPGGRLAVTVWREPERMGHLAIWREAIVAEYPDFDGFDRPEGWTRMQTPEGLHQALNEAGLDGVEVHPLQHDWPFPAPDELLTDAHRNPFFDAVFAKLGPGSEGRVRDRLRDLLHKRFGNQPFAIASEALCGVGTA